MRDLRLEYQGYDRYSQTSEEGPMDWFYNRDTGGIIRPAEGPGYMGNGWIQILQNYDFHTYSADSDRTSIGEAENATFTSTLRRSGSEASVNSPEVTVVPNTQPSK